MHYIPDVQWSSYAIDGLCGIQEDNWVVFKLFTKKLNLTMTDLFCFLYPLGTIALIAVGVNQLY